MNKTHKNQKGFTAVEGLLIVLILVVIGAVGYMVYHNNHKTNTTSTTSLSTNKTPSTTASSNINQSTENSENTARANDANSLLTAFDNYANNNESDPPTTITSGGSNVAYLCASTSCNSSDSSVVNLDFYKPQEISITGTESHLTVPNDSTVYISGGTTCFNKNKAETTRDAASIAVIYALQNGNSITQQCITD